MLEISRLLPLKMLENVPVGKNKYFCVGFAYKGELLKAVILNENGEVFPVDYHKIVIDF